jgi:hypothetical protein
MLNPIITTCTAHVRNHITLLVDETFHALDE